MARQVEIHVTGLAFCFIRQDTWHLIFVSDAVHQLTLKDPDGGQPHSLRRGTSSLVGDFAGARATDNSPVNFPHNRIPNLSDEFAHNGNLALGRFDSTSCILSIRLPGARLQAPGPDTGVDCFIQEVKRGGGGRKKNLGKVSTKVVFRFQLESNDVNALTVTVTEQTTGDVYNQSFPKTAGGGTLVFEFDNGCGNQCDHNDSIDLYHVLKDKGGDLQFVSGADLQNGNVPGHDPNNPYHPPHSIGKLTPTYGNCDPVGGEPPPDGSWPPS